MTRDIDDDESLAFMGWHRPHLSEWDLQNNIYLVEFAGAHTRQGVEKYIPKGLKGEKKTPIFVGSLFARDVLVPKYGFAIPNERALRAIEAVSPHGVLEIGAGCGYWAHLLSKMGVSVAAYDDGSWQRDHHRLKWAKSWHPIDLGDHWAALKHPQARERTLLLIWASLGERWPEEVLANYQGPAVCVVGESTGGCTATDKFFDELEKSWKEVQEVRIPQYIGIHDNLIIYRRGGRE